MKLCSVQYNNGKVGIDFDGKWLLSRQTVLSLKFSSDNTRLGPSLLHACSSGDTSQCPHFLIRKQRPVFTLVTYKKYKTKQGTVAIGHFWKSDDK